ncbi:MAG: hypothetical protein ACREOI_37200 [bacterium]
MTTSLNTVKKRLRGQYLKSQLGIHGFGISPSENAIKVYLHPNKSLDQKALLHQIEKDAAPYKVIAIFEEPPLLA